MGFFAHPGMGQANIADLDRQLDNLKERLFFESEDGNFYFEVGLQFDNWIYNVDGHGGPTGFWFPTPDRDWDSSQRVSLFFDAFVGDSLYFFTKIRWDDGVHPGLGQTGGDHTKVRFDEFFVRYSPSPAFNLQAGQFPPLFGGFLSRQNSWDMGLISYPMPYENVTSISDSGVAANPTHFAERRNHPDNKLNWVPIVWAPLYTLGGSAFGSLGNWGYALNVTNSAPSSRGSVWNDLRFSDPTILGRLEYRFGPDLSVAGNFSHGSYFQYFLEESLPPGTGIDDYRQTVWSLDAKWAYRDFQVWAEIFYSIFDVPNVGEDAEIFSYFIEGRWDFDTRWWAALRWNQEVYNQIDTCSGQGETRWDNPLYRIDAGLGFRFSRHAQIKFQYSYQQQDAIFQNGRHLLISEFTIRL